MLSLTQPDPGLLSVDWLKSHGPRLAILILFAVLVSRLASMAVRRFRRGVEGSSLATTQLSLQRTTTLAGIVASTVRVTAWTVVALMLMGELGLNLAPLLAGAGVAGLALGFGAQSLVRDFLAGFFILLEDQYAVGDSVELTAVGGSVVGKVDHMTLRTTSVRAADGTLSVVPNGNIQLVANRSRGLGQVTVEVRVPLGEDVEQVRRRLSELLAELRTAPDLQPLVNSGPVPVSVEPDGDEMVLTVSAETRPSRREDVERELQARIKQRFRSVPQPVAVSGRD
jgi:moderate conductance mechanosensitive channel